MKKLRLALILISLIALFSCKSYTIKDSRDSISLPESGKKVETRFNVLEAERLAEEERIASEIAAQQAEEERIAAQKAEEGRLQREAELEAERLAEEERIAREKKAEEERLEKERLEKELRILNAINYYPEDLSDISIPHLYRPAKEFLVKDNHLTSLRLMLIPMGEKALTAENIASIISSISDIKADFIALTGSRENQVAFAKAYNKDSITFEDGTIIFRSTSREMDEDSAIFTISTNKAVSVSICDMEPEIPATADEVYELMAQLPEVEEALINEVMAASESSEEKRILFLSSMTPSTSDWDAFTAYEYRDEMEFGISDALKSDGWIDAFDASRFSVETESGITRKNGEIFERMDFIYVKSLICMDSIVIPAAGLTDTVGSFITIADVIIP